MNRDKLKTAVQKWGTPLYLFDLDELKRTVLDFRNALGDQVKLCFAVKANPFVLREMAQLTDRIEVCSMGEYRICMLCQVPPEKLLISGVLKKEKDLREILEECGGRCMYTAESERQFQMLAEWSEQTGETLKVFPRLSNGSQFGMDRSVLEKILSQAGRWPHIVLQGLHYFTGTQKKNLGKIGKELQMLDQVLAELKESFGFEPKELEYGPGLWVDYFGTGKSDPSEERRQLGELVRAMAFNGQVTLEMGRALAAYCGSYLTGIMDVKCNKERSYAIVDGGLHQLNYDGQIRGMYLPKLQILRGDTAAMEEKKVAGPDGLNEADRQQEWTICGSLCTTNDVLLQQLQTEPLKVGDVLVFEQVGAYSVMEGMAVFLSHELPAVVSYEEKNGWHVLREEKETYPVNTPD